MFDEPSPPDAMRRVHQNGMYQRTNSFSTTDPTDHEEIDLMEILQEIPPDDHFEHHQAQSPNGNESNTSNESTFILIIKGMFAFAFGGLQKLHVTSRTVHKFLILHFLLSCIGLSKYLELNPNQIMEHHQYWRLFTCSLAGIYTQ